MIKKLKILIISILIVQSVYSQVGSDSIFPKLYVDGKDTFLILTIDQIKKLNVLYFENDKHKTLIDLLLKQNEDYELVIIKDKDLINNLKEQLMLKDDILCEKDDIIKELNDKDKKLSEKLKRNMFFNKGLIIISVVLSILVLI